MKSDWEKLVEFDRLDQYSSTWDGEPIPIHLPLYIKHCTIDLEDIF